MHSKEHHDELHHSIQISYKSKYCAFNLAFIYDCIVIYNIWPFLFQHMKLSGNFSVPGDIGSGSGHTDVGRNLPAYLGGAAAGVVGLIMIVLIVL